MALIIAGFVSLTAAAQNNMLWYSRPAQDWNEALPIGNGRLAAMVFGQTDNERIQFNEDTFWAGGPYNPNNSEALQALPEARRLIFAGKYKEADDLIGSKMMARPLKQMPYQPVGDLKLTFPGHNQFTDYRRDLDLETAIATRELSRRGREVHPRDFCQPGGSSHCSPPDRRPAGED